ncbi:MAG: hypothetical protein QNJ38_07155 [Prochloraceae cyanobacterium]|nr:hypothetical protein [Prochloraceae cyanobacterium]
MSKLRNFLLAAGVTAVGAVGTKMAVDYFQRKKEEEEAVEEVDASLSEADDIDPESISSEEVAYVTVDPSSVQDFLDRSFGSPGRYVPTRPPKVFDYQGQQYMVIWAYDNQKEKNQMLAFIYTDAGRKMIGSVGYTADVTDYNINMEETPFAVEVNEEQITSGQGQTDGAEEVDFVLAA